MKVGWATKAMTHTFTYQCDGKRKGEGLTDLFCCYKRHI